MGRLASTVAVVCVLSALGCQAPFPVQDVTTLRQVTQNPDAHKGVMFAFRGRVIHSQFDSAGGTNVQVMVYDDAIPELVYVNYPFNQPVQALNNDTVAVLGKVDGRVDGTNAFGGPTSGLRLDGVGFVGPHEACSHPDYSVAYDMWKAGTLWKK